MLIFACAGHPPQKPAPDSDTICAEGEVLDGEICVPEACGVGTWGNLPVDGNTMYVNIEASDGGEGSEAAPLTSIQAAVDLAGDRGGGLVAVAAGTYVEVIAMGSGHDGVTMAGRCKEMVTIDASKGDDVPAIEMIGKGKMPEIAVEGVTVTGGTYIGIWVENTTLAVSSSDAMANALVGILALRADVDLDGVGVYGTTQDSHGNYGRGIDAESGTSLTATGCTIQESQEIGVLASEVGTKVDLVDTRVLGAAALSEGALGRGVVVQDGAALTATGCTVQGNTDVGVFASSTGTSADLVDTQVLDTAPAAAGNSGCAIVVQGGAALTARGCTLRGSSDAGLAALDAGTTVDLVDTEVLDTAANRDDTGGNGIRVRDGAALTATGCTVQGNLEVGVLATGAGAAVDLVDTRVLDTAPSPNGVGGYGVAVQDGAELTAVGCTIQRSTQLGVGAQDVGTTVDLLDTEVLDTSPSPDGTGGGGIGVAAGAAFTATGCTIQGNTEVGVAVMNSGTSVDLVDTTIFDTSPAPDGTYGRGVNVEDGAALTATRCTLQRNTTVGVYATGFGTTADLVDTEVLDTSPSPNGNGGAGIQVQDGAALSVSGCTVQGNTNWGAFAGDAGTTLDLVDTAILDTSAGADGNSGFGLCVADGAALNVMACTIQGNTRAGVGVWHPGTTASLVDTEVLNTSPSPDGRFGRGIDVNDGAALTATGCRVEGSYEIGVIASSAGTTVDLVDTRILETQRGRATGFASGVTAQNDALLRVSRSEISDTAGPGLFLNGGGRAEFDAVQLRRNTFAGVVVLHASAWLTDSTITDTAPDAQWGGGFGVYTIDRFGAPTLYVTDSTIGPHDYAAVWLDGPGSYDIEGNTLSGSAGFAQGSAILHGNAVFAENGVTAWDGATGLMLADNTFSGSTEIGVLLDGSSATLGGNSWSDNGTDVRQQDCDGPDGISGPDESGGVDDVIPLNADDLLDVPSALVCPTGNVLTAYDLMFTTLYLPTSETDG